MLTYGKLGWRLFMLAVVWLASSSELPAALRAISPIDLNGSGFNTSAGALNYHGITVIDSRPDADGISRTGVGTDLAIRGPGWFVVREPVSGDFLYRRFGDFRLDAEGYLITNLGYRVQGFTEPSHTHFGDIQVNDFFRPDTSDAASTMTTFQVEADGSLRVYLSDGSDFVRAQILLQNFGAPDKLERVAHQLFASTPAAQPLGSPAPPGSGGLGVIVAESLDATPLPPLLKPLRNADPADALIEGLAVNTGKSTDLAIHGPGAFLLRDPRTSELFATRAGTFLWDRDGYLITYDRKRVQGYIGSEAAVVGDIQVGSLAMTAYVYIDLNGRVVGGLSDGTQLIAGKVLLFNFHHPDQLTQTNLGQFSGVASAQPYALENVGRFGGSFSRIEGGRLELINVPRDLLARRQHLNFFTQGALVRTDVPTDLAIDGNGFFQLKHPRSGQQYVTRRGDFRLDANGYLVSAHGFRVQGYGTAMLTEVGDVRIDAQSVPATTDSNATIVIFTISRDGHFNVHMSDGTEFVRGQVLLQSFRESFQLRQVGGGLYGNLAAAVPLELAVPGTSGLGGIESSALECPTEREQLTLPESDGFRLGITGEPGSKWIIQATEDFTTWKTIGVVPNAGFESEFCDRHASQHPRRFYRVLAEYPQPLSGEIRRGGSTTIQPLLIFARGERFLRPTGWAELHEEQRRFKHAGH